EQHENIVDVTDYTDDKISDLLSELAKVWQFDLELEGVKKPVEGTSKYSKPHSLQKSKQISTTEKDMNLKIKIKK
ncbi:hypothetical protein HK096_009699, partial [Nowakowskiella sp. JEL0078]